MQHWQAAVRAVLETEVGAAKTAPHLLADVILTEFALTDRAYVHYAPCIAENA